ncbi:IPT/TIG domain-containing protein, partial [Acidimicrobiia bacterium EGI L10123]|nr:IPT/TIG domain-containing protein [Acidimicrobiia bacterium EGI L10123]
MARYVKARRALAAVLLTTMVATTLATSPSGAQEPPTSEGPPPQALERRKNGEAAIQALGDRLPAVAAAHGMGPGEFRRLFRGDPTLWIDADLRAFYIEPPHDDASHTDDTSGSEPSTSAAAPFPLSETFTLHSNPGADRTILLDFDGQAVSGTSWNLKPGIGGPFDATPFSLDDDPLSFSPYERDVIQSVWLRVSEDFAAFDVDVTTEEPADPGVLVRTASNDPDYGTRVVFAGADTKEYPLLCGGCGGVAYLLDPTSFGLATYQPAWVFQKGMGGADASAKSLAEAASHEVGHNLGLEHDGRTSPAEGYFQGHGSWAPIMGIGYSKPIVQWSKGEYANANNYPTANPNSSGDDDLAMIGHTDLLPPVADDHANTNVGAPALGIPSPVVSGDGVISTRTDVDVFEFEITGPESVTITASPAPVSPNLDISMTLRDATGAQIGTVANPASGGANDIATGLDATITAALPTGGFYYVHIDGVGHGDPLTNGYSDYASLGAYDLDVAVEPDVCFDGGDPVEDDVRASAQLLVGGQTKAGLHCDEDWYLVPGVNQGVFGATLVADDGNLDLQLVDSAGVEIDLSNDGGSTETVGTTFAVAAATDKPYYLRVFGPGVQSTYTLTTSLSACPADDQWENDDGINVPSPLALPGAKAGVVCSDDGANKVDYAEVNLTAGEPVRFTLTYPQAGGSSVNLWLFRWPSSGSSVSGSVASPDSRTITYTPTVSGAHQIRVDWLAGAQGVPYHLEVEPYAEDLPVITTLSRSYGVAGDSFSIVGSNFNTVSDVSFSDGVPAAFTVNSPTWITATVPAGAETGPMTITNSGGPSSSDRWFSVRPTLAPPANDDFADPVVLTGATGQVTGSNAGATMEPGEYSAGSRETSVWYQWTAPSDGELELDTFGSTFDTILNVYTGTAVNVLPLVAANDDDAGIQSRIAIADPSFPAFTPTSVVGGTTYRIGINGYQGDTGDLTLNWTFTTDLSAPFIDSIAPTSGEVGDTVTITGSGLQWTTDVDFNGTPATFTVVNDTEVTTTVPEGATDGPITVTTPGGATPSGGFDVTEPPPPTGEWGSDGSVSRDVATADAGLSIVDMASARIDGGYYAAILTLDGSIAVGKYDATDTPDPSFNDGEGLVVLPPVAQYASGSGLLAVDSVGRPYLLATSTWIPEDTSHVRLVRLTTAGALDTSFSDDGIIDLVAPGTGIGAGAGVEVDSEDRPVTVAQEASTTVRRFTTAGAPDGTFQGTSSDAGAAEFLDIVVTADDLLAVLGDDSIVVAGTNFDGSEGRTVRLASDGTLATGWGIGGANPANLGPGIHPFSAETMAATGGDGVLIGASFLNNVDVLRLGADGTLDTAFGGGDGQATALTGMNRSAASGHTNAISTVDGVYVHARASTFNFETSVVRLTTTGEPDSGWNAGSPGDPVWSDLAQVRSIYHDGALRLGGTNQVFGISEAIERMDAVGGGASVGGEITVMASVTDYVLAIAPLSEGAYVAYAEGSRATIAKHNDDGSLDTDFGSDGALAFDPSILNHVDDLAVDGQGRLLMVGQWSVGSPPTAGGIRLIRLTTGGALDTSFDGDGIIDFAGQIDGTNFNFAYDVRADASDRVVVAGTSTVPAPSSFDPKVFLQRFTEAGALDTTFGGDGGMVVDLSTVPGVNYTVGEVRLDAAGDLRVFASTAQAGVKSEIVVIAIDGDGVLDTSYGVDGFARYVCPGTNEGFVYGGNLLADGSAVFAASCDSGGSNNGARAGRFTPAGALDTTYAGGAGVIRYLNASSQPLNLSLEVPVDDLGAVYLHGFNFGEIYAGRISANGTRDAAYERIMEDDGGRPTAAGVDEIGRLYIGTNVEGAAVVNRIAPVSTSGEDSPIDFNGDGLIDIAIFRPSTGRWAIKGLPGVSTNWGQSGDVPVPADYD